MHSVQLISLSGMKLIALVVLLQLIFLMTV